MLVTASRLSFICFLTTSHLENKRQKEKAIIRKVQNESLQKDCCFCAVPFVCVYSFCFRIRRNPKKFIILKEWIHLNSGFSFYTFPTCKVPNEMGVRASLASLKQQVKPDLRAGYNFQRDLFKSFRDSIHAEVKRRRWGCRARFRHQELKRFLNYLFSVPIGAHSFHNKA